MNTDAKFWDDLAERYAEKPVENVPAYERKLALTKARLMPRDVVLDIGCGTGSLALELAPHVAHVHALDISSEMLRIAGEKAALEKVDNISLHQTTLTDLTTFESASFDVVCAYNILHLVDDRIAALRKIFDLLKPGGSFISSTMCLGDSYVPYVVVLSLMRWAGKAPRVHVFEFDRFEEEIRERGFVEVVRQDVGAKKTTAFVTAKKGGNRAQGHFVA